MLHKYKRKQIARHLVRWATFKAYAAIPPVDLPALVARSKARATSLPAAPEVKRAPL